jgi:transposase-like protein
MKTRRCPQCGSEKATTVMLPAASGAVDPRPRPAFRCMACDTQWTDEKSRSASAEDETDPEAPPPP